MLSFLCLLLYSKENEQAISSRAVNFIEDDERALDLACSSESKCADITNEKLFTTGPRLLQATKSIDEILGGIILNTYITSLLLATTTLYAGSSIIFNTSGAKIVFLFCFCCFLLTLQSSSRLIYHTNAGQYLASSMERCAETLNKIEQNRVKDSRSEYIKLLREEIKSKCKSPINPLSAFSLSNSTLIGTFATILTYLIVLIQFKAAEDEEKTKSLNDIKGMLLQLTANRTTLT